MANAVTAVHHRVEVQADPQTAFRLYTTEINRWWKRDSYYWNDRASAQGLRFEPFVGGRFIEIYDAQTGDGFEIGRILVWEPGERLVYTWRETGWAAGEQAEVDVRFEPVTRGTCVTVTFSGWERIAGGQRLSRGYEQGLHDLLGWYEETAANPA